jgi:hypothetical protein
MDVARSSTFSGKKHHEVLICVSVSVEVAVAVAVAVAANPITLCRSLTKKAVTLMLLVLPPQRVKVSEPL